MARQFFGTDGIRGRVNQKPMTVETALATASATTSWSARVGPAWLFWAEATGACT